MTISPQFPYYGRKSSLRMAMTRQGFSLVEVVLATGLVMFALLVIFSLMPAGLASLQEANRQIVETEVFASLGAELSSTPFTTLDSYVTKRFPLYYDREGGELKNSSNAVFTVRCALTTSTSSGAGDLRWATVSIGYHRDPNDASVKADRRTFLLVNRGF